MAVGKWRSLSLVGECTVFGMRGFRGRAAWKKESKLKHRNTISCERCE
jgi:hypothetical protein